MNNSQKYALVTGGSGGIGSAICQQLAKQHHVFVHANRNLEKAQQVAETIKQQGSAATAISFDVTDAAQTKATLDEITAQHPIQILVNNCGIHADAPMAGMTAEQWSQVIAVSLQGFYNVTQPLLLPMMSTRWGRIINISSIAALTGNRGQTNYAAAKAGLHGATKSLALELAKRQVTVNAVAPGIIKTDMSDASFSEEMIKAMVPMQRAGTAAEVAALVDFLACDAAGYISGQIISINGAMV